MIGLPLGATRSALEAARHLQAAGDEDEWGYDAGFAEAVQPFLDALYDRWWRVHASGTQHVGARGRALIVANHAGVLPWDAAMIATALRRGAGGGGRQDPRFLVLDRAFELPWASVAVRRFGGVPASPYNALRLLEQEHAVIAFPEGDRGTGKPFARRYRLERFGRGGFVEVALRTGAPIVPCAVVGSEEIYPRLADLPGAGRLLGAPGVPVTPTFPALGALGLVPLPSRWRIAFGEPIALDGHGPGAADDRALVFELAEDVRARVQGMVHDELARRGSAFR